MTWVFNDTKCLTVVISLAEENEVTMAPAFRLVRFLNFRLFLFIVKEGRASGGHGGKTCFHELRQPPLYYCLWLKFILSLAKIYSVASVYVFYKRVYVIL